MVASSFVDVCRFTPTAGGTADFTYSSAVTGYNSPALAGVVNGATYSYRAENSTLSQWEIGTGTYDTGTGVLTRGTVLYNSSGTGTGAGQSGAGSKINFTAAPQVALVALAEDLNVIGAKVNGGTTGSVLFVGASSELAQDNANFLWDNTNNSLRLAGAANTEGLFITQTLTGSATNPALSIYPTWNTSGTAFGIYFDNVDTASSGNSYPLYVAVNGVRRFAVRKDGNAFVNTISSDDDGSWALQQTSLYNGSVRFNQNGYIGFSSSNNWWSGIDTYFGRDGANVFYFAGNSASAIRVYNSGGGVNYERGVFDWTTTANVLTIGTEKAGTGSTRNLQFITGGTTRLDYGITGANDWSTTSSFRIGGYLFLSGTATTNHIKLNNSSATYYGAIGCETSGAFCSIGLGVADSIGAPLVGSLFTSETGMTSFGGWNSASFPGLINSGAVLRARLSDDSAFADFSAAAGTHTSASASALTVGLAGATNPAFQVDSSVGSQAAGFKITGAVTGGTVALAAIDSGSNTNITINAKGSGTIGIGSASTGIVTITPATTVAGALSVTDATAASSNTTGAVKVTGGAGFAKDVYLATGTTAIAPLTYTAGTNLTTARAGAVEFDGKVFYETAVASSRQVVNTEQVQVLSGNRTFTNNTSAQAIFNASTNGAITLAASTTYEFEMDVAVSALANNPHTVNLTFAGTATLTSIGYFYDAQSGSTLAGPTATLSGYVEVATATAVIASTSTTGLVLRVRGTVRVNAGGTFIPQLTQVTASAAAVVRQNSFFRCWPIGSDTVTNIGNWS